MFPAPTPVTGERRSPDLLAAALAYAERGWRVLPVASKKPRIRRWPTAATTNRFQIRRWWHNWPSASIGVLTGRASGIVVVDVDPRNILDIEEVTAFLNDLPATRTHATGGGGSHYIYACRSPFRKVEPLAGVEILGDGQFIVVPPSTHPSGGTYVVASDVPVADLPRRFIPPGCPEGVDRVDAIARLEEALLGRAGSRCGDEVRFLCPFHPDSQPSAQFNRVKECFNCFGCKETGGWRKLALKLGIIDALSPRVRRQLERIASAVITADLPGSSGATDRAVLLAHVRIAQRSGSATYQASSRQVADESGVQRRTVEKAHRRLNGWLIAHPCDCGRPTCRHTGTGPGHSMRSTTWTLTAGRRVDHDCSSNELSPWGLLEQCRTSGHSAFRPKALGRNGFRVLALLSERPTDERQLATILRMHRTTAHRMLKKAAKVDAASHTLTGWIRGPATLDEIAAFFGTAHLSERDRLRHREERRLYHERLIPPGAEGQGRLVLEETARVSEAATFAANLPEQADDRTRSHRRHSRGSSETK